MRPQLWLVRLWAPPERLVQLRALLSAQEREQADRFAFDRLRPPFIVAHAALRILAGRALGADPAGLRFAKGPFGKPHLVDARLPLNLSHAGDWGLVALGHRHEVGVDIEAIHPARVTAGMVRMVTSTGERATFDAMDPARWAAPFFRLWVRKEAVIKALGTGLSRPLDSIDVPLAPEAPPDGIVLRPEPEPGVRSWLWDVPAPTGYFAALVVRQPRDEPPRPPEPVRMLTPDALRP
ncbi:MAG: 4'-phosphopantetheinyl transferase superfamily protein [Myxococcales bacterium]|nr:4'-phosphopantetheinyl transferase superfamily protein [Myxococcales bacterium]